MKKDSKNIAFKCTYNNGGETSYPGFNGTCSKENIIRNIGEERVWCGLSECKDYFNNDFKGTPPEGPCYESVLFKNWEYGGGVHHGIVKQEPVNVRQIDIGKIAVLTTRFPGEPETKRRIIGLYRIGEIRQTDDGTIVKADLSETIKLPLIVCRQTYFWDYYTTEPGVEKWNTGLYRYLEDEQVDAILTGLLKINAVQKKAPLKHSIEKMLIK